MAQEIEGARLGQLKVDDVRAHFAQLEAAIYLNAWWNGAALDRLIDARHARVVNSTVKVLTKHGWLTTPELSFSEGGERGSIDVFAGHVHHRAVFVGEAKSEWGSVEETLRRLHMKTRLAPRLAITTFGWRPVSIASVLIFPEDRTARRVADQFATTLQAALPADSHTCRRWLRSPSGDLRGIWFLTDAAAGRASGK